MIFLTTLPNAAKAAELYAKRWKIECLFRHLKTKGYNLEDLNLKDPNKNLLMMAIVTTAYILAIREGLAILTAKCYRFLDFLNYLFKTLSTKNHAIFKNVQ